MQHDLTADKLLSNIHLELSTPNLTEFFKQLQIIASRIIQSQASLLTLDEATRHERKLLQPFYKFFFQVLALETNTSVYNGNGDIFKGLTFGEAYMYCANDMEMSHSSNDILDVCVFMEV